MACEYCDLNNVHQQGESFYDDFGCKAAISYFTNSGIMLGVKSDGVWTEIQISHCPWCGSEVKIPYQNT